MVRPALVVFVLCVIGVGVQGLFKPDTNERDLVDLLRRTLSMYKQSEKTVNADRVATKPQQTSDATNDDVDDIGIEDLDKFFNFPGSDFLQTMVMNWLKRPLPGTINDILNEFPGPQANELESLRNIISPLLEIVGPDKESFAEFMARFLTRAVFDVHVNCPTSILNKFLTLSWKKAQEAVFKETSPLLTLFNTSIPMLFPTFADNPENLRTVVVQTVKHTHERIMSDTEQFLLGLGFLDVARFSGSVYKRFLTYSDPAGTNFTDIVTELITESGVACTMASGAFSHDDTMQMFLSMLESTEMGSLTEVIDKYMKTFLEQVIFTSPEKDVDKMWKNVDWTMLKGITTGVYRYILNSVIPDMSGYINVISNQQTDVFLGYFDFLDASEATVLTEVLNRLGWPAVTETPSVDMLSRRRAKNLYRHKFHH